MAYWPVRRRRRTSEMKMEWRPGRISEASPCSQCIGIYHTVALHCIIARQTEEIRGILNKQTVIIRKYFIHATDVYQVKRNQRIGDPHARRPTEKFFVYVVASEMTESVIRPFPWKYKKVSFTESKHQLHFAGSETVQGFRVVFFLSCKKSCYKVT